jgi:hypothetical protein
MNLLVMNIKRDFFADILAIPKRKRIEYRDLTDYWLTRLEKVGPAPFKIRLLNGMLPPVPEAIIIVEKVVISKARQEIQFHLGRICKVEHWDRKTERPLK